jgi:hypothetical protein
VTAEGSWRDRAGIGVTGGRLAARCVRPCGMRPQEHEEHADAGRTRCMTVSCWPWSTGATRSTRPPPPRTTWCVPRPPAVPTSAAGLLVQPVRRHYQVGGPVGHRRPDPGHPGVVAQARYAAAYGLRGRLVAAVTVNMPIWLQAYQALIEAGALRDHAPQAAPAPTRRARPGPPQRSRTAARTSSRSRPAPTPRSPAPPPAAARTARGGKRLRERQGRRERRRSRTGRQTPRHPLADPNCNLL